MKITPFLLVFLLTAVSCQFFDTKKITPEEVYGEEIKSIDWNEVDQYPVFPACSTLMEKRQQKECFENTMGNHIYQSLQKKGFVAHFDINDTLLLNIKVEKDGKISVVELEVDSLLQAYFPNLREVIFKSVDSITIVEPAYKRGIPVKTQFILPLVLQTQDSIN